MGEHTLAIVSSLAVAGLAGISLNHLLKESVLQALRREGLEPISGEEDEGWGIILEKNRGREHGELAGELNEKRLYEWCRRTLIQTFGEDKYRMAKRWCIGPERNGEVIGEREKNLRPIGEGEVEVWKRKAEEYSSVWRIYNDISMEKRGKKPVLKSDISVDKLRIWCENKRNGYFREEKREEYEGIRRWCYVKGGE